MEAAETPQGRPKPQSRACEACRAAKIRCQAGPQPGICKRCSEFKRECIFRTGPRKRRSKVARGAADLPPPPGPSKTFSIDFSMPFEEEPSGSFDELREQHEHYFHNLVPSSDQQEDSSTSAGPTFSFRNLYTPSSTASSSSRPLVNLGIKPQFNLDSAENLLQTFKKMLPSCPFVVLDDNADVRIMARDSPFILLAVLSATSSSTSLQGYSLYDEEFRKVLGLKFVTGGERTLELLQGILLYCTWYPFHLRPKQRQALQYLKMAIDIVHELEIDQEETYSSQAKTGFKSEDLAPIRAFVACYYLTTIFANLFSAPKALVFPYPAWITKCCDILERENAVEQDQILVWQIRLHQFSDEIQNLNRCRKTAGSQDEHHRNLIRMGLETQLREWQSRIPTNIAIMPSVMMASLFDDMHLAAAPLMCGRPRIKDTEELLDPQRLLDTTHTLRAFFDFITCLRNNEMAYFASTDWGHMIIAVILGLRLSLPVDGCPQYDAAQARQIFDFGMYLERLCREPDGAAGGTGKKTDTWTAFRVVLRSLKAKYEKKLAALAAKEDLTRKVRECPMFDGSLDDYITMWDGHGVPMDTSSYPTSQSDSSGPLTEQLVEQPPTPADDGKQNTMYHDLWATMTLGWGTDEVPNLDIGNVQLDYDAMGN